MKLISILIMATFLLSGCQPEIKPEHTSIKNQVKEGFKRDQDLKRESYLRILPIISVDKRVSFNANDMKLTDLLRYSLPKDIRVRRLDRMVDFQTKVSINASNLTLSDYIRKIFDETEYEYSFDEQTRELGVFLMQQKSWDLSAFSSATNTTSSIGGGSISSSSSKTLDKWKSIVDASNKILALGSVLVSDTNQPAETNQDSKAKSSTPNTREIKEWIIEDRAMATLTAYASAKKINILDKYITRLKELASTQIQLEVKAFEVTLSDDTSSGINWNLFDTRDATELGGNFITGQLQSNNGTATALSALTSGQLGLDISGQLKGVGISAIVSFLEKHGEVHLVTEPTITVLNGGTAFLSSGDKISYNSGFETLSVEGSAPIIYPKSEQVDIGTTIALTPNVSAEGDIVIDVLATLTSLKKMHTTILPIGTINNPELAVQEISTQVIANNNESVRLGGLIVQRLSTTKTTAPTDNSFLSAPFDSGYNNIEKRELVMIITPKIIPRTK